jgi:hypothetical protein
LKRAHDLMDKVPDASSVAANLIDKGRPVEPGKAGCCQKAGGFAIAANFRGAFARAKDLSDPPGSWTIVGPDDRPGGDLESRRLINDRSR